MHHHQAKDSEQSQYARCRLCSPSASCQRLSGLLKYTKDEQQKCTAIAKALELYHSRSRRLTFPTNAVETGHAKTYIQYSASLVLLCERSPCRNASSVAISARGLCPESERIAKDREQSIRSLCTQPAPCALQYCAVWSVDVMLLFELMRVDRQYKEVEWSSECKNSNRS